METNNTTRFQIQRKSRMAAITALPYVVLDTETPATRGAYAFKVAKSFPTVAEAVRFADRKNEVA